jgi:hypothetical protein
MPSQEHTGSDVCLVFQNDLRVRLRTNYRVDSGSQEEQVDHDVSNLLQEVKARHFALE